MLPLSEQADLTAALGHISQARDILAKLNYEELGITESFLGDAHHEIRYWKDQGTDRMPFTKRGAYCGP